MVIGEDDVLMREGIARLLAEAGFEVVAQAGDAEDLVRKALAHKPGRRGRRRADAAAPRRRRPAWRRWSSAEREPGTGVLVLSQYYEESFALDLLGERADGVGYLLKERVGDVEAFVDAVGASPPAAARWTRRWCAGWSRGARDGPLARSPRASARCSRRWPRARPTSASRRRCVVSEAAVEKHVRRIFQKLGLEPVHDRHRRVLAVLTYLRSERPAA